MDLSVTAFCPTFAPFSAVSVLSDASTAEAGADETPLGLLK